MTISPRKTTASLIAALGLSALSPVQTGAALLTAGAALWTSPALAGKLKGKIIGVTDKGTITRSVSDGSVILVASDANGEVRIIGLEPGEYDVAPLRLTAAAPVRNTSLRVGPDGRLAFVARTITQNIGNPPKNRMAGLAPVPFALEAIPFDRAPANAVVFDMRQAFRNHIDVNASSALDITRLAPETSREAAEALIAERTRGGPFRNAHDFASRVCTRTAIDFGDVPVRFGDTSLLVMRGGQPKDPGWKCVGGKVTVFAEAVDREVLISNLQAR